MLSLGTMIYLIARAVPRISDEITKPESGNKFGRFFSHVQIEKIDPILHNFLEKTLRKIKLILMRMDSITNSYLEKVKNYKFAGNGNGQKNEEEKQNLFANASQENNSDDASESN
jgi:hypothetical protein